MRGFEVVQRLGSSERCLDVRNSQEFCCYITFLEKQCFPQVERGFLVVCGLWSSCSPKTRCLFGHVRSGAIEERKTKQTKQVIWKYPKHASMRPSKVGAGNEVCLPELFLSWTSLSSHNLPTLEVPSKPNPFRVVLSRTRSFTSLNVTSLVFEKWLFSLNHLTGFSTGKNSHSILRGV